MPSLRILRRTAELWGLQLPVHRVHGKADRVRAAHEAPAGRTRCRTGALPWSSLVDGMAGVEKTIAGVTE